MKKHQALYDLIIKKELADAEHLQVWLEQGSLKSPVIHSQKTDLSVVLSYTINILISDTDTNQLSLFFLIVWWMNIYQPERKPDAFTFEVDHKNKTTSDVFIQIPVTEKAIAKTVDGTTTITVCDKPLLLDGFDNYDAELWLHDLVIDEQFEILPK